MAKSAKYDFIASFEADLLILQEVREKDFSEIERRVWVGKPIASNSDRGLGVFSLKEDIEIVPLESDNSFELYLPVKVRKGEFEAVFMCVWASNFRSAGIYKGKRGVFNKALTRFEHLVGANSIWLGDFNNGPEIRKGKTWFPGLQFLNERGMEKIAFEGGAATYKKGSVEKEIDHLIVGSELVHRISAYPKVPFEQVPSDHRPLVFDLKIA